MYQEGGLAVDHQGGGEIVPILLWGLTTLLLVFGVITCIACKGLENKDQCSVSFLHLTWEVFKPPVPSAVVKTTLITSPVLLAMCVLC